MKNNATSAPIRPGLIKRVNALAVSVGLMSMSLFSHADTIISANGHPWDIQNPSGVIVDGGNDAFDNYGYINLSGSTVTGFGLVLSGRTHTTGTPVTIGGVQVTRRLDQPAGTNYLRYFDTFTNTSGSPITVPVAWGGNLGSDSGTILLEDATGDNSLTAADAWALTGEGTVVGDPIVGYAVGLGGLSRSVLNSPTGSPFASSGQDNLNWVYQLTLAPGESASLVHFLYRGWEANRANPDGVTPTVAQTINAARTAVVALSNAPDFSGLSAAEQARIVNWESTPGVGSGLDFQILTLGSTGSAIVDHNALTSDDRGGIAVSGSHVFVTGDGGTARYSASDLSGGVALGTFYDGLCGDIGAGKVYTLAFNGTPFLSGSTTQINQLIELDPGTGSLTANVIPLTLAITPSTFFGANSVFSGRGRVVIHNGTNVYDVLIPSGATTDLGPMAVPNRFTSESWAIWGVAEFFGGELHLAYRSASGQSFERARVPDGLTQTIATFTNLSDLANWTVDPSRGRWYFHYEGSAQFGGVSETLGFADATFTQGVSTPVSFTDAALESAIRTALSRPTGPITAADMLTLTNLNLSGLGLTSLSGLEAATNLRILNLRGNAFTDAAATWAILDELSLYCLYTNLPRPGGNPPGLTTQLVTDTSGGSFFIVVDAPNLPTLDISGLGIDTSNQANLAALQVFASAGVTVQGGANLLPVARASFTITNATTGAVVLNGSASNDIDGTIVSWSWSWSGGSASGANPTATLPLTETSVTLTVTDDDGATGSTSFSVDLSPAVVFANLALENAIRTALAKPTGPITAADMLALTNLNLSGLGLTSLSGLEAATNLRILNLRGNAFSDAAATWAILDELPLYCLYTNLPRPGGNPPGLTTQLVTDTSGGSFFIVVDAPNLPTLDISGLGIDTTNQANLAALQVFTAAGVTVATGATNLPPAAVGTATVTNQATGATTLDGSVSRDIDGTVVAWAWTWAGGAANGSSPSATFPVGTTSVTLTVTDDDGATSSTTLEVVVTGIVEVANVLILGTDIDPTWNDDAVAKLTATAAFNQVNAYNAGADTPTLAQLLAYDAVLVHSNLPFANAALLGDRLADYVDAGGGLVVTTFAVGVVPLQGRIFTDGYLPYGSGFFSSGVPLTLVADLPGHPLLSGVTSFHGGTSSFHGTVSLAAGATQVARWSNGLPLVMFSQTSVRPVIALNFFPGSSDARSDLWDASTDGAILMRNALQFTHSFSTPVNFADANLEVAIRAALAKPTGPITAADMLALTNLNLSGLGLTSLSGLEAATNLRILNLRGNAFSDAAATWATLDELPLYCLYTNLPRPGGNPPGLTTQLVTDTSGGSFFIVVDAPNLPTLDISGLGIDTSNQANLAALQVFSAAGVTVQTGGLNLPPVPRASFTISNATTGTVVLNGSASSDIDGTVVSWSWSWTGGSASGANPTVTLPVGETAVTLTVTDDDGAVSNTAVTVRIVTLASAIQESGLIGEDALPNATPFDDGVENLIKYAFNMDLAGPDVATLPPGNGTSGLPSITIPEEAPPGTLRVEFLRRKGSGLIYTPQKTSSLDSNNWTPLGATPVVTPIPGNDLFERVTYEEPPAPVAAPACFGRVSVSVP